MNETSTNIRITLLLEQPYLMEQRSMAGSGWIWVFLTRGFDFLIQNKIIIQNEWL
jgi:hypothetical protein